MKKHIEWLPSPPEFPKEVNDGPDLIEGAWTNGAFTCDEVLQHLDKVLTKYRKSPGSAFPFGNRD
ncbi:MAG: hypothetical protein LC647_01215 [Beggiatoa sp.]|nr:hypothetical protein [Beggiatoa sp.]